MKESYVPIRLDISLRLNKIEVLKISQKSLFKHAGNMACIHSSYITNKKMNLKCVGK